MLNRGIVLKNFFQNLTQLDSDETWFYWYNLSKGFSEGCLTKADIPRNLLEKEQDIKHLQDEKDLSAYFLMRALKCSKNSTYKKDQVVILWIELSKLITPEFTSKRNIFNTFVNLVSLKLKTKDVPKKADDKVLMAQIFITACSNRFIEESYRIGQVGESRLLHDAWTDVAQALSDQLIPVPGGLQLLLAEAPRKSKLEMYLEAEALALMMAVGHDRGTAKNWYRLGFLKKKNASFNFNNNLPHAPDLAKLSKTNQALYCFIQGLNNLQENQKEIYEKVIYLEIVGCITDTTVPFQNLPISLFGVEYKEENKSRLLGIIYSNVLRLFADNGMIWHNLAFQILEGIISVDHLTPSFFDAHRLTSESNESVIMYCYLRQYSRNVYPKDALLCMADLAIAGAKLDWDIAAFPIFGEMRKWDKQTSESFFVYCQLQVMSYFKANNNCFTNINAYINNIISQAEKSPLFWRRVDMGMMVNIMSQFSNNIRTHVMAKLPEVARLKIVCEKPMMNIKQSKNPQKILTNVRAIIQAINHCNKSKVQDDELRVLINQLITRILQTIEDEKLRDVICLKLIKETALMPIYITDEKVTIYTSDEYITLFHLLAHAKAEQTFALLFYQFCAADNLDASLIELLLSVHDKKDQTIEAIAKSRDDHFILTTLSMFNQRARAPEYVQAQESKFVNGVRQ